MQDLGDPLVTNNMVKVADLCEKAVEDKDTHFFLFKLIILLIYFQTVGLCSNDCPRSMPCSPTSVAPQWKGCQASCLQFQHESHYTKCSTCTSQMQLPSTEKNCMILFYYKFIFLKEFSNRCQEIDGLALALAIQQLANQHTQLHAQAVIPAIGALPPIAELYTLP